MAYTIERANEIFDFFTEQQGMELSKALALTIVATGDPEIVPTIPPANFRLVLKELDVIFQLSMEARQDILDIMYPEI